MPENLTITAIAAIARNGVIGSQGTMPWHIPGDFRRFKHVTMGGVLIMGRTTFESIGKPLPGRTTIVISRRVGGGEGAEEEAQKPPVLWAASVGDAINQAAILSVPIFIVGGAQIYRAAWPYLTRLDITEVDLEPEGDAMFPPIDETWVETSREPHDGYSFVIYDRVPTDFVVDASVSLPQQLPAAQASSQNPSHVLADSATSLRMK